MTHTVQLCIQRGRGEVELTRLVRCLCDVMHAVGWKIDDALFWSKLVGDDS